MVSTSEVSVSLTVDSNDKLPEIADDLSKIADVKYEGQKALVCLVGEDIRGQNGMAAQVFTAVKHVNVRMISQGASEINMSFMIDEEDVEEAVLQLLPIPIAAQRLLPGLTVKDGFMRHPFDIENHVQTSGLVRGRIWHRPSARQAHHRLLRHCAFGARKAMRALAGYRSCCAALRTTPSSTLARDGPGTAAGLADALSRGHRRGAASRPGRNRAEEHHKWERAGRARCPMKIVCQDVTEFKFPANPCVGYMFNPFREPVLKAFVRHIGAEFAGRPGRSIFSMPTMSARIC
jgi:hypothetical protein